MYTNNVHIFYLNSILNIYMYMYMYNIYIYINNNKHNFYFPSLSISSIFFNE